MRVLFKKGAQRSLIFQEKMERKLTWREFANELNIKPGRLHSYYYEESLLPIKLFEKFILKEKYRDTIVETKNDNWGKSKGGLISKGNTKTINNPEDSFRLAEFYGIMLGDGNLTKIKDYKIGTYQARIVGDSRYDRDYLLTFVKPLMESLFKTIVKVSKERGKNALILTVHGKGVVSFLESKGFNSGNKINNRLRIPPWIKEKDEFLRACLRGLYDTDGTAYKLTNQNSYQIAFTNYNRGLLEDVRESLIHFGISPSKICRNRDITITKKSELLKFLNHVGFSNSKHFNKVKMWNLAL